MTVSWSDLVTHLTMLFIQTGSLLYLKGSQFPTAFYQLRTVAARLGLIVDVLVTTAFFTKMMESSDDVFSLDFCFHTRWEILKTLFE